MGHKFGRRITLRDAKVEELRVHYPTLKCIRKRDPKSFSIWFKRMDFKDGWEYDDFYHQLGHLRAKFSIRGHRDGIMIDVSNYTGYLERRVGEPKYNGPKFVDAKSRSEWNKKNLLSKNGKGSPIETR